jgi:ABC-2 type transport system permease protein
MVIRTVMLATANIHFVSLAQSVLFRGAGFRVVWPHYAALLGIGVILFWSP